MNAIDTTTARSILNFLARRLRYDRAAIKKCCADDKDSFILAFASGTDIKSFLAVNAFVMTLEKQGIMPLYFNCNDDEYVLKRLLQLKDKTFVFCSSSRSWQHVLKNNDTIESLAVESDINEC